MITWSEHVAAGNSFAAENFELGVGGQYASVQLLNPVASGIRIRLHSLHAISPGGVIANIRRHDTPLATSVLPSGFVVQNLLGGQPVAVGEMRRESLVALVGSPFWLLAAPSNIRAVYPPLEGFGFDLLEGHGIMVTAGAGVTIIVNWHWVELPL